MANSKIKELLEFLRNSMIKNNIDVIDLDKTGFNFSSNIWEKNFDLRYKEFNVILRESQNTTENVINKFLKDIGNELKEFMNRLEVNSLDTASVFFKEIQKLSQELKIAILHGYIKAEFGDGNQVIYLTQKGLDRVDPIK